MRKASRQGTAEGNFFEAYRPKDGSRVPKYQQIRFALIEAIRSGHWSEGARVPTEEELVRITGASLGTVQRAVRMLAEDGVLSRRQGSGTFVSHASSRISEPWHFQFIDEDGETVLPAYPKVVARERTSQRGAWSRFLAQGETQNLRIDRVINVNDEFNAFSRFFVAGPHADLMEAVPVEQLHGVNFRIFLSDATRLPVTRISHNVSIIQATAEQARRLGTNRREPLLRVEIAASAGTDVPLYFQELLCPPTERRLSLPSVGRL